MLRIEDSDRVRLLTLDRPDALNAFNDELYHATGDALREATVRDDVACVVVTGTGRAFSAGQDLGEMARLGAPAAKGDGVATDEDRRGHGFPSFLDTFAAFPKPMLCAVNGLGVGVGFTMLLHADLVFMARSARLRAPFVSLGVVPEAAGSVTMPLVMGQQAAAYALYTAEWITAEQAKSWNIAFEVCDDERLLERTMEVARAIARMPVVSLRETKQIVLAGRIDAVRAARRREDETFARLVGGPANMEALTAFLEKRPPDFSQL